MTVQPCQSITRPTYTGQVFPCLNSANDTLCGIHLCWRHTVYWKARLQVGERIRIHPQRLIWDYSALSAPQVAVVPKEESVSSGPAGAKRCSRCGKTRPLDQFRPIKRRGRLFLDSWCQQCNRERALDYYHRKHPAINERAHSPAPPPPPPRADDTFEQYWADQGLPLDPAPIEDRPALPPREQDARPPEDAQPAFFAPAGPHGPPAPTEGGIGEPEGTTGAHNPPTRTDRPLPQHLHREAPRKAAAEPRAAKAPLLSPTETRTSGVDDTRKGVGVPSAHRSDTATASTLEARTGSWHKPFVVHKPKRDAEVVTLEPEPTDAGGRGTNWPCNHAPDQLGGIRCINCCASKPQHYVELVARGGTPARRRWLCDACLSLFEADGRVAGHERRYEVFAVPGYQDGYSGSAAASA